MPRGRKVQNAARDERICEMRTAGASFQQIMDTFNISRQTAWRACQSLDKPKPSHSLTDAMKAFLYGPRPGRAK